MKQPKGFLRGRLGWFTLSILMALVSLTGACGSSETALPPADATYEVEGTIQRIGGSQGAYAEIVIRHRSITDFRNREGEVVGMESMAMPFAVASEIPVEGLAIGDPVSVAFEVRWEADPVLLVTGLELLPPGTRIDFGNSEAGPVETEGTEASATGDSDGADESEPEVEADAI